eukprot:4520297-Pleurochrysis_carterae.AAC.2
MAASPASLSVACDVASAARFASRLFGVARLLAVRAVLVPAIALAPATGLPLIAPSLAFARALRVGSRNEGMCIGAARFDIALHVAGVNVAEHNPRGLDGERQVAHASVQSQLHVQHGGDSVAEVARGVCDLFSDDTVWQLCGERQRAVQA